jgi:IstB-like ATP binding protein
LFRLRFIDEKANAIFLGLCGIGKTHLATALGYSACQRGYSVLFANAIDAINTLSAAQAHGALKTQGDRGVARASQSARDRCHSQRQRVSADGQDLLLFFALLFEFDSYTVHAQTQRLTTQGLGTRKKVLPFLRSN